MIFTDLFFTDYFTGLHFLCGDIRYCELLCNPATLSSASLYNIHFKLLKHCPV